MTLAGSFRHRSQPAHAPPTMVGTVYGRHRRNGRVSAVRVVTLRASRQPGMVTRETLRSDYRVRDVYRRAHGRADPGQSGLPWVARGPWRIQIHRTICISARGTSAGGPRRVGVAPIRYAAYRVPYMSSARTGKKRYCTCNNAEGWPSGGVHAPGHACTVLGGSVQHAALSADTLARGSSSCLR